MNADAFARLQQLFHDALEQPAEARSAWLAAACGDDLKLRADLEAMLTSVDDDDTPWEHGLAPLVDDALRAQQMPSMIGRTIGAYQVTRLIGYGGMGAVYEGVRVDDQFTMRVAIKMMRKGADSELAVRRFRYERQILANLRHRNIAGLLDGGVTEDHQPYFVMEYVDGQPITSYCRQHALSVRQRVLLLRQVCTAVQHAHEGLVVHRDLKPGNVHVTADGTVKLLDFGIARLMREPDGMDYLPPTEGNLRAFTPDYASPEQFLGLPAQPASDIYSLGVIACEVLTGHRPFVLDGLLLSEAQARVCMAPAPAPSSLLTDDDAELLGTRSLKRAKALLTGDLDAIVLQALRKEPERRYRTAEQMNADLQRHLEGRPVLAQRDRLSYRVGKFVRRYRAEVAAATTVVLALVAGTVVSVQSARRADRERDKAAQVNEFLQSMLAAANPDASGRDVTVQQVLGQAARDLASRRLAPEIESEIRFTLANTYYALGVYDSADVHARRAFQMRRDLYGPNDVRTANVLTVRAAIAEGLGNNTQAESLATSAVAILRSPTPVDGVALASALDNLARVIDQQGRIGEAEGLKRELLTLRRQGTDSASRAGLVFALTNLAVTLTYRGDLAGAEALQREALEVEASVHGRSSATYADVQRGLASILEDNGNYAAADSLMRELLPNLRRSLGESHTTYLRAVMNGARVRLRLRDFEGAVGLASDVTRQIGAVLPEGDITAASTLQVLGAALDSLGRTAEAEAVLLRAWDIRRRTMAADSWLIAAAEATVGAHYLLVGRYADAERLLTRGYEGVVKEHGAAAPNSKIIARRLVLLYQKTGETEKEKRWLGLAAAQ